jgi:hypothetical protein
VYHWGIEAQDRFLIEFLGPAARELHCEGLAEGFWFTRFDARGPHLLALFTPRRGGEPEIVERLSQRVTDYLARRPSAACPDHDELAVRHAACRGKWLCEMDRQAGIAANNSYCFFSHPADGYPFSLTAGLSDCGALWQLLEDLAFWTIAKLEAPQAAALRWVAGFELCLRAATDQSAQYWRFHLLLNLPALRDRTTSAQEEALEVLFRSLGANNQRIFGQVWQEAANAASPPWPHLASLVELALAASAVHGERRWGLLREIVHWTLGQLGMPIKLQLPLLLYAWSRSMQPRPGGLAAAREAS